MSGSPASPVPRRMCPMPLSLRCRIRPRSTQSTRFGKIPVMRHGDITLCESRAICFYIDHAFAGPPLAPRDASEGARTEQWISLVNTHIDPLLVRQYLTAYFFPGTSDGRPNRAVIDAAAPKMEAQFAVLDRAVGKTGHLVGEGFTLADI